MRGAVLKVPGYPRPANDLDQGSYNAIQSKENRHRAQRDAGSATPKTMNDYLPIVKVRVTGSALLTLGSMVRPHCHATTVTVMGNVARGGIAVIAK